jgi:hypothetical protein
MQALKPNSGCGLLFIIVSSNLTVLSPIVFAQFKILPGFHSRYFLCADAICSLCVKYLPFFEVWFSNKIVDIYYEGKKVATHPKSSKKGKYFTLSEHMASAHKKYLEWNPGRILNWAKTIGDSTVKLLDTIMKSKPHPELGFKACMGILNLYKKHLELETWDENRLDAISSKSLQSRKYRVDDIKQLLKNSKQDEELTSKILEHKFVRGSNYYN